MNTGSWPWFAWKHIWNIIEEIIFEKSKKCNFWRQFLQLCFKYASEQIVVKIQCSKYQKLFKTLIRNIFQDMYCCAHKTATLTPIQHIVPPCFRHPCSILSFNVYVQIAFWLLGSAKSILQTQVLFMENMFENWMNARDM